MRDIPREIAEDYQEFFDFLNQEHNLILTISEMDELVFEAQKLVKKLSLGVVSNNEAIEMKKLQKQHIINIMQEDEKLKLYSEVTVCCETCKHLDNDNTRECNKCDDGYCMWEQQADY
jgi:hypothetical protein